MWLDIDIEELIYSSRTPRDFIKKGVFVKDIPQRENETKSEEEGGSYGN